MLSVSDAMETVLQHVKAGPSESVSLTGGLARVLSQDLLVPCDSPAFDKSLMDGFAVSALSCEVAATAGSGEFVALKILETITAGRTPSQSVGAGTASRIMTGAPLPVGCDCVVPVELTAVDDAGLDTIVFPASCLKPEMNLMRQGTAARAGSQLLKAGTRLQPQQIAVLAEFGFAAVSVHRKPTVAVLATGDELTAVDEPLQPGRIRNSNEPMLLSQIAASDSTPVSLGIARDDAKELAVSIQRGLCNDVLLLTGGVSAGILDLVPQQLRQAGVNQVFHGVHMKPGKPLWFGYRDDGQHRCLVFGLPGNPVSSLACFELFVRPALKKFCGSQSPANGLQAVMSTSLAVKGDRPVYHPVAITLNGSQLMASPVPWTGSSDLRATVDANGMALLHASHGPYQPGDVVEIWLWGEQRLF